MERGLAACAFPSTLSARSLRSPITGVAVKLVPRIIDALHCWCLAVLMPCIVDSLHFWCLASLMPCIVYFLHFWCLASAVP